MGKFPWYFKKLELVVTFINLVDYVLYYGRDGFEI